MPTEAAALAGWAAERSGDAKTTTMARAPRTHDDTRSMSIGQRIEEATATQTGRALVCHTTTGTPTPPAMAMARMRETHVIVVAIATEADHHTKRQARMATSDHPAEEVLLAEQTPAPRLATGDVQVHLPQTM